MITAINKIGKKSLVLDGWVDGWVDGFKSHFKDCLQQLKSGVMDGWMDKWMGCEKCIPGWMGGWMKVKAVLRIAFSNQKYLSKNRNTNFTTLNKLI